VCAPKIARNVTTRYKKEGKFATVRKDYPATEKIIFITAPKEIHVQPNDEKAFD